MPFMLMIPNASKPEKAPEIEAAEKTIFSYMRVGWIEEIDLMHKLIMKVPKIILLVKGTEPVNIEHSTLDQEKISAIFTPFRKGLTN